MRKRNEFGEPPGSKAWSTDVVTVAICVALGLSLVGCGSLEERAQYLTGPEVFVWGDGSQFRIQGKDKMWGAQNLASGDLSFHVHGFPPGTALTIGEQTATVDDEGFAMLEVRVASLYGTIATADLEEASLDDLAVSVAVPGGATFDVPLQPETVYGLDDLLEAAAEGPVLFAGESSVEGPIRNVIWFHSIHRHLLGAGAPTLADLDAVAVATRLEGSTKTCTGYVDDDGKPAPDIELRLRETKVTIYERRTGREVATRTFGADEECPTWAVGDPSKVDRRDSPVPDADIVAWLETQVAAP